MKTDLEKGIANFIRAAVLQRDGEATIAIHHGSVSPDVVDETVPAIIVMVMEHRDVAGLLSEAVAEIVVSSPMAAGKQTAHDEWTRFVIALFPPAVPPYLGLNAGHLSYYVLEATGDVSCNGYHRMDYDATSSNGRWVSSLKVALGLQQDNPNPLEAEGDITY